jgi:uncharacterized membrane protein
MKRLLQFFRTTLAGGILFLMPIALVAIILERALALARKVAEPLAKQIPIESVVGLRMAMLLALGLILLFCFLTGFFARTALARKLTNWLETTVLSNLPGYEFFKSIGENLLNVAQLESNKVLFAHIGDTWQIGFQLEQLDNGLLAVFIPNAPNPNSGAVHFVTSDRVIPANIPSTAALKCLKRLGTGSNTLFGGLPVIPITKENKI